MNSTEGVKGISAVFIIDVMGRPKEHLAKVLENVVKAIDSEAKVSVTNSKIHDPVELEQVKGNFTSYAEIEVFVDDILYLFMLMFKYFPAHVEVQTPELIALTNNGWNEIMNELLRRLHSYDDVAKMLQSEKMLLINKLKEVLPEEEFKKMFSNPNAVPQTKVPEKKATKKKSSKKKN